MEDTSLEATIKELASKRNKIREAVVRLEHDIKIASERLNTLLEEAQKLGVPDASEEELNAMLSKKNEEAGKLMEEIENVLQETN